MFNKQVAVAIAGGVGMAFLGYCVYFDKKRRSDPDFKRKLREKRFKQRESKANQDANKYPDLNDEIAVQGFFMNQVQLGEQCMALGDIENGVEHLANAVAVTTHKENLLNLLRSTLPEQIFQLIIQKLPEVSEKIYRSAKLKASSTASNKQSPTSVYRETTSDDQPSGPKIVDITEANLSVDDCLD